MLFCSAVRERQIVGTLVIVGFQKAGTVRPERTTTKAVRLPSTVQKAAPRMRAA